MIIQHELGNARHTVLTYPVLCVSKLVVYINPIVAEFEYETARFVLDINNKMTCQRGCSTVFYLQ